MNDYDLDYPIATWEAVLLPEWQWEAYEKEDEALYYGRVKSPLTEDQWEWGYFSATELERAKAYRTDTEIREPDPLYPDGGTLEL